MSKTHGQLITRTLSLSNAFVFASQDANGCDNDIAELRGHQQLLNQQLDNKQREFHELQGVADTQDGDIEHLVELKQKVGRRCKFVFLMHYFGQECRDILFIFQFPIFAISFIVIIHTRAVASRTKITLKFVSIELKWRTSSHCQLRARRALLP